MLTNNPLSDAADTGAEAHRIVKSLNAKPRAKFDASERSHGRPPIVAVPAHELDVYDLARNDVNRAIEPCSSVEVVRAPSAL
jgi:hypothetical protein